ncbi:hypothetical protein G6F46_005402 [Rhizopus delemar]|uniref:Thioredoxin-like protein 4A n=2 Tax=Rhizopus TaxID=4842 RepID=A0A9P6Z4W9_9FUNG|nr:hypothetical protein G6F55_004028 [Rhizopus delemar]KAG1545304.1 hypothetical protein G6F51_005548 [Rhizopus arrhizus]KAG1498973.1 hypothetical protein G6F54_004714 [Rhizopus delemar]KAG1512706.1 hypothetical protein G6F53_004983 [Rhizopus delemar]KAG1523386.1 hypothetical protein G6F52_005070 [Rhizopus delemar]
MFLPVLYKHIILGHRQHTKQLEQGLSENNYLKQIAGEYTQTVTLRCRHVGSERHWRFIFEQLPNVHQLYFRDDMTLSIKKIQQVLSIVPQATLLDIRYCNINNDDEDKSMLFTKITELNLMWTDFSQEAIKKLFQSVPNLKGVTLGANHNKKPMENDAALYIMQALCPSVEKLSISLQQVKESTLCKVLAAYNQQLVELSLRCEGDEIIKAISHYTKSLKHLVIRHSGYYDPIDVMDVLRECGSLNHFELYFLPHLTNGWQVDQAILSEEDRVVVIRFGHDWDPTCMQMDEILYSIAEKVKNFAVIYLVDITEVPDFNKMYELYDPCTTMFFFRNKHIMIDLGTGNNNKINWALDDKQEMIDLIEIVYRGARKGRGLVVSLKDYSTKYKY